MHRGRCFEACGSSIKPPISLVASSFFLFHIYIYIYIVHDFIYLCFFFLFEGKEKKALRGDEKTEAKEKKILFCSVLERCVKLRSENINNNQQQQQKKS